MKLKFLKTRDVKTPSRGDGGTNDLSAGLDFYTPEFNNDFVDAMKSKNPHYDPKFHLPSTIRILPQGRYLIPTGIKLNLQTINGVAYDVGNGVALIAHNRGSIGSRGIVHGACVVDEDYQGELFMSVINTSNESYIIESGQKLLQFLLIPILKPEMVEVFDEEDLFSGVSNRGEGSLGSTNGRIQFVEYHK